MSSEILNRFDRILAILLHLQAGRVVTAQVLSTRFQVSLRTIYRDIRSLEAAGVPVIGEAGHGYSLMEGYRMPPMLFTREEAGSFVAAEKLMQKFSDKTLNAYHKSAMLKIKAVMRGNAKDRISALESQIWIHDNDMLFNANIPDALDILFESMAEKKQVAMDYQSFHANEFTTRKIEPIGMFYENNFWHVMGFCHLRKDYRQFRTDRIMKIKRLDDSFTRIHGEMEQYRKSVPEENKTKVVIKVQKEFAKYMKYGRRYYGFVEEETKGDFVEMTFMTHELQEGFPRWFLMFSDFAEIISPPSLKNRVLEIIEKAKSNIIINQ